jgi:cobalamin biosynthesis Mg chelatase CobN
MAGGREGRGRIVGAFAVASACALVLVWALAGPGTGTALAAESSCARQVLRDWTDNGRIDGIYPSACYLDAIASLPEDVRTYSSAVDDISRAMQSSEQKRSTGAGSQSSAGPSVGQTSEARRISAEAARQVAAQSPSTAQGLPPALLAVIVIAAAMVVSGIVAYFLRRAREAP